MFEYDGKKFLNEQEAIAYALDQITKIKQSLGDALPNPIAGPTGPAGATGATGPTGPRGKGFYGVTATLPSATAYEEGDFYLLSNGNVYKKVGGNWLLQYNLKGPQGPVGLEGGTDVVANPVDAYTDNLEKIKIDGTTYNILPSEQRTYLDELFNNNSPLIAISGASINIPNNFSVDGSTLLSGLRCTNVAIFDDEVRVGSIDDIVDKLNNEPIIICENLNDANGDARFVEGNLTTETITGVTFTYAKWSLSGSHLMIVLAGEIAANTTTVVGNWASVNLPNYIANKITPVIGTTYIAVENYKAYHSDWTDMRVAIAYGKYGNTIILQQVDSDTNTNEKAQFRVQFDLLIDME